MRFFKVKQRFYDASTATGGEGGGGKEKDDDDEGKDDQMDNDIKKELEGIKSDIKKITENSSEKNSTLESLQKQIDKLEDGESKSELEKIRDALIASKNENVVLKLEVYKSKALESEKINTGFAELITVTPEMKTEDIDKLVKKAQEIQEKIKQDLITVNQDKNPAFGSNKGEKNKDDFYERLEEEAKLKEEKKEMPNRLN